MNSCILSPRVCHVYNPPSTRGLGVVFRQGSAALVEGGRPPRNKGLGWWGKLVRRIEIVENAGLHQPLAEGGEAALRDFGGIRVVLGIGSEGTAETVAAA